MGCAASALSCAARACCCFPSGAPGGAAGVVDELLGVCAVVHADGMPAQKPSVTPAGNPLPRVVHEALGTRNGLSVDGRLIAVGDVHGCLDELLALLDAVGYRGKKDTLVFTGDLLTKGPASLEVLRACRKLKAHVARGNNDDGALAAYYAYRQAGDAPAPKFEFVKDMTNSDADYVAELPFTVSLPEYGVCVAHGGLVPGVPLKRQDLWAVSTMRDLYQHVNGRWEAFEGEKLLTPIGSVSFVEGWRGPPHVIFGHDSKRGLQLGRHATGVDTACVSGGRLTAAVLPPLRELRRSEVFVRKLAAGEALTFDDLQGRIVSVPSQQEGCA